MHLTADVLETARLAADGHADFLAKPHAAIKATIDLADLRLDYLQRAIHRFDLTTRKGRLSHAVKSSTRLAPNPWRCAR